MNGILLPRKHFLLRGANISRVLTHISKDLLMSLSKILSLLLIKIWWSEWRLLLEKKGLIKPQIVSWQQISLEETDRKYCFFGYLVWFLQRRLAFFSSKRFFILDLSIIALFSFLVIKRALIPGTVFCFKGTCLWTTSLITDESTAKVNYLLRRQPFKISP